jgi:hypothetical protein
MKMNNKFNDMKSEIVSGLCCSMFAFIAIGYGFLFLMLGIAVILIAPIGFLFKRRDEVRSKLIFGQITSSTFRSGAREFEGDFEDDELLRN